MKKLNITKEQFDKSRYLKHKYGNLKFVSESGKLFKTDTGKILKFVKESVEYDYQLVKDWVKRAKTAVVDATVGLMDEQSKQILLNDAIECLRLLDDAFEDSATDLAGTKFHINETPSVADTQADPAPVEPAQEVTESKLSNFATIEDFDPNEPEGEFILTLVDQNGSEEEIHFYMDVAEDWGNVNNDAGCFWPCDEDATDVEYFDGVGFGNDEDGYKKVVKVVSVDLNKEMTPEDFGNLCDQYVDWFSA